MAARRDAHCRRQMRLHFIGLQFPVYPTLRVDTPFLLRRKTNPKRANSLLVARQSGTATKRHPRKAFTIDSGFGRRDAFDVNAAPLRFNSMPANVYAKMDRTMHCYSYRTDA
jgi:hypothetical protein